MKIKQYSNVMAEAEKNPKFEQLSEMYRVRIYLAELLHQERTARQLTIAELAERAHISPMVISQIEDAQISTDIELICKLLKALGKNQLVLEL
jgi:ribosome-binding protein aMBF1 (putative translation factor)